MVAAINTEPLSIEGVKVYNSLPARSFVDLDKECLVSIGGEIDPFDGDTLNADLESVINSGTLKSGLAWGITSRNEYGFATVLVDTEAITEQMIKDLIGAGIITR
jgi:hypothetical protein